MTNVYSPQWFQFFHTGIDDARTTREADFICALAPQPDFRTVIDVCCGMGRHARALSQRGYLVTGIERDRGVLARARELGGGPSYINADIRDYQPAPSAFDLVIIMSQSFGYFDPVTNREMLNRLASGVRPRGRIILDLWNPDFFAAHQGEHDFNRPAGVVYERKRVENGRLFVQLSYPDGNQDNFEWQLFTEPEMAALAESVGLAVIVCCTEFDSLVPPCPNKTKIQFVLERR